jgi:hypothetical protein
MQAGGCHNSSKCTFQVLRFVEPFHFISLFFLSLSLLFQVLSSGQLVEQGSPGELGQRQGGMFAQMLQAACQTKAMQSSNK